MFSAALLSLASASLVAGSALRTIPVFGECRGGVDGVCESGTRCSSGNKSYCLPLRSYTEMAEIADVKGFGRPIGYPTTDGTDGNVGTSADEVIAVFTACTDANFSGSCITFSLACNFCAQFSSPFVNSISSIQMLDGRVGCNFWVNTNCAGDGIKIDSGAIFNLGATAYNDRITAFNCYIR